MLERIPVYEVPYRDANGEFLTRMIHGQDIMVWVQQGAVADRTRESLAWTDRGLTFYRNLLKREIAKVEQGLDPLGTIRDPAKNVRIDLPLEVGKIPRRRRPVPPSGRVAAAWPPIRTAAFIAPPAMGTMTA